MNAFEGENMGTQYNALGHSTDWYFHDYKLAIETDKTRYNNRNIDYEIKKRINNI